MRSFPTFESHARGSDVGSLPALGALRLSSVLLSSTCPSASPSHTRQNPALPRMSCACLVLSGLQYDIDNWSGVL